MQRSAFLLTFHFLLIGAASTWPQEAENEADLTRLQGVWTLIAYEKDGEKQGAFLFIIDIKENHMRMGTSRELCEFRIDSSKAPKQIDIVVDPKNANDKKRVLKGIYKVTENELALCNATADVTDRPRFFGTRQRDGLSFTMFRRLPNK
jgi:uncharacterized protein (TIGR03067 family)